MPKVDGQKYAYTAKGKAAAKKAKAKKNKKNKKKKTTMNVSYYG